MRPELALFDAPNGELVIRLMGEWKLTNAIPSIEQLRKRVETGAPISKAIFDTVDLHAWDSGLVAFVVRALRLLERNSIVVAKEGLPEGVQRLLELYITMPERKEARADEIPLSFLEAMDNYISEFWHGTLETVGFIGDASIAFLKFFMGKARFRRGDLAAIIQQCGAEALPIVSLISILVGLILAFVSAIQLKFFGTQIYVATLVGIGMVRALAPIMTGVIMAGRTGAAFAAQLGTMEVNEEIDALTTFAISPIESLVVPRMLALFLMMPLLAIYADLMGMLGGLIIAVTVLNLDFLEYYNKTRESVSMNDFWVGLFSATVFGILVALAGCLRGMQCRRSASAVGDAATSAVVTGIISIVIAMAVISSICNMLKI